MSPGARPTRQARAAERRRRARRLTDPTPTCPYGCGAPVERAALDGDVVLVNRLRAAPDDARAVMAVRRTGTGAWVARSLRSPSARPLEPGEHRHHDHDDVCTARAGWLARRGAQVAEGVVDITKPRRTT
ncbi:hypothetical protein WDZ16_13060 [Pseudokineococcus marinus]|uniref:Uncharacterized protein n=1 Tax=Pseudokineococcus marinus TaxID=351215 RepID=A0A849BJY0_9ACTN|nr:hypothetical protein [Pseudokineococcus marinus]NNH21665.1 hypothetical protein [Pseudokineococcus marinus]